MGMKEEIEMIVGFGNLERRSHALFRQVMNHDKIDEEDYWKSAKEALVLLGQVDAFRIKLGKSVLKVRVLNRHGKSLSSCSPLKASRLLKKEKAIVFSEDPFTIQLICSSVGYLLGNLWSD